MKLSFVASFGLLSLAAAQSTFPAVPACAATCVGPFLSGKSDKCTDKSLISDVTCCVSKSCNDKDQSAIFSFAQSICKANGATIDAADAVCTSSGTKSSSPATTTGGTVSGGTASPTTPSGGRPGATTTSAAATGSSTAAGNAGNAVGLNAAIGGLALFFGIAAAL